MAVTGAIPRAGAVLALTSGGGAWHVRPDFQPVGVSLVTKPNWGLKRTCQSCGTRFYDLEKDPIICPKCGAEFDPEVALKTKRTKAVPAPVRPVPAPAPVEAESGDDLEPIEEEVVEGAEAEEKEDEGVMEDTSELGEDDEDVAEVVDNVDDEER
jgi:uncharacterized protein (TIGR02300 family)